MEKERKGSHKLATVIGVFTNRPQAERAVQDLRNTGVNEEKISIVAREGYIHGDDNNTNDSYVKMVKEKDNDNQYNATSEDKQNLSTGTTAGGAIGGVAGLLAGAGLFTIPGVGPILALGPIISGLAGAAAGGITGGLVDLGISPDVGDRYQAEVERGGILAAVECDQTKINNVAAIFRRNGARDVETY